MPFCSPPPEVISTFRAGTCFFTPSAGAGVQTWGTVPKRPKEGRVEQTNPHRSKLPQKCSLPGRQSANPCVRAHPPQPCPSPAACIKPGGIQAPLSPGGRAGAAQAGSSGGQRVQGHVTTVTGDSTRQQGKHPSSPTCSAARSPPWYTGFPRDLHVLGLAWWKGKTRRSPGSSTDVAAPSACPHP